MATAHQNEQTPLLSSDSESEHQYYSPTPRSRVNRQGSSSSSVTLTPPKSMIMSKTQLAVILLVFLAEPVTCTIIYPFIAQLITELGITHGDSSKIGFYAGLFDGLPLVTEAIAILPWSYLSDRLGRRPVIVISSFGLALAAICFGLQSRSLVGLILARSLLGLLNGNTGTVKTVLGELVGGDEKALASAFGWMPIVYAVGATIAPMMGGLLEHPAKRFPSVFASRVWEKYPYLLPSLFAASIPLLGSICSAILLKETRPKSSPSQISLEEGPEHTIDDTIPPKILQKPKFVFTRNLALTLLNYSIFILLTMPYYALFSIFLASHTGTTTKTAGGLGLRPTKIGLTLAVFGIVHGFTQVCFFSKAVARFGVRTVYKASICASILLYANLPIMHALAVKHARGSGGHGRVLPAGVWILLGVESVLATLTFSGWGCMYVMITKAAPSPEQLATTNGLGQIVYSLLGSIGPTFATSLFAISASAHTGNAVQGALKGKLVYIVMASLGLCTLALSSSLSSLDKKDKGDVDEREDSEEGA